MREGRVQIRTADHAGKGCRFGHGKIGHVPAEIITRGLPYPVYGRTKTPTAAAASMQSAAVTGIKKLSE
jgi:hypothetical protein